MSEVAVEFSGSEGNLLRGRALGPEGLGPSVLFMHGGGQTHHSWRNAARRVARQRRAVLLDARGHGTSDWPESGDYRFNAIATDLAAVCRALQAADGVAPVVVGASMGGLAAMLAADEEPNLYSGLVLVDIVPRMEQSGVDRIIAFMGERSRAGFASVDEAAQTIAVYRAGAAATPRSQAGLAKNLREGADGRWYWHWDPRFVDGPLPIEREAGGHVERLERGLQRLACPLMLVRGSRSQLVSEDAVAAFRSLVPQADYVDISGAGHMVVGDRNDAFAEAVLDFLNRL